MPHRNYVRAFFLSLLCLCILVWVPSASGRKKSKQEVRQEKEEERTKKEEKKRGEEEKKYNTIAEFTDDLYASDPDFHDAVDKAYRDLQGDHALQAFEINTTQKAQVVTEGDVLRIRRALYDDPRVQNYVNRVGQALVPPQSTSLYAFRLVESPIPAAYTLSTGTIYISTGLVSLTDNEAQLAYILSHELAHVYKDHWKAKVMTTLGEQEWNKKQVKKKRIIGGIIGAAAGAVAGGVSSGAQAAVAEAIAGGVVGMAIGRILAKRIDVDWEFLQENEADDFALKNSLDRNYDVQEIPKLYVALTRVSSADKRAGLGFVGNPARLKERTAHVQKSLETTFQADYQQKLKAGALLGTSPDYQMMMTQLKRDNGILAFYYDMFGMAQDNLRQAVNLRSDDARAHYYYAKVVKLVARTDAERTLAKQELIAAIKLDQARHLIPEAELQRALLLMDSPEGSSQAEASQALRDYIVGYQDSHVRSASLPPNMELLYDYLRLLGEATWRPPWPEYPWSKIAAQGPAAVSAASAANAPPTQPR
jgi:predicted Zn-dependent protease